MVASGTQDYYKALGVSSTASKDEIRRAYKKLARKYHPDAKPDDKQAAARFKEIQEAWSVLGNDEKREQYDRFGTVFDAREGTPGGEPGRSASHPGGGTTWNWSTGDAGFSGFDLDDLFGGRFDFGDAGASRRRANRPRRGGDARTEINVPFEVAVNGGKQQVRFQTETGSETLTVTIPAGVDDGSTIRLRGKGAPSPDGGERGDLLAKIRVAPHPWFKRFGQDLLLEVPLTISEAALGTKIDIPTLSEGSVRLTIPPGTGSGRKLRLKGKGVADRKTGRRGDLLAVVKIVVPKRLNDEAKQLLRQIDEAAPLRPREGLWR